MDYVHVFISHQQGNKAKALALKDRIDKDPRFSCYIAENTTTKYCDQHGTSCDPFPSPHVKIDAVCLS